MTIVTADPSTTVSIEEYTDEDEVHVYCPTCDPHALRALCGTVIDGGEFVEDDEGDTTCVVCADLEWLPCSRCGYRR